MPPPAFLMKKSHVNKLLIFAHVPPPHHGQAVMVELMLQALRGEESRKSRVKTQRTENMERGDEEKSRRDIFHVDARVSDDIGDVGGIRPGKIIRLFKFCFEAILLRIRHGAMDFYYVPAPAKKSAIVRDWLVMALVRPWFRRTIFHWHAFGLGHWATGTEETPSGAGGDAQTPPCVFGHLEPFARWLTRRLHGNADLSIVLTNYNRMDAALLDPKQIKVVPNGIADMFSDCEQKGARSDRIRHLHELLKTPLTAKEKPEAVNFLFMGHLIEGKGVFVAVEAVKRANAELAKRLAPWRARLTLAGSFASTDEKTALHSVVASSNLAADTESAAIDFVGFLGAAQKKTALWNADVLLFPTFYDGETQGLVLLEAMSAGVLVISSSWRGVAEVLPEGYPWIVRPRSIEDLVCAILNCPGSDQAEPLRRRYEKYCSIDHHREAIRTALA